VLLLSRSHRQSTELFRIVLDFYRRLEYPMQKSRTAHELHLTNFSHIVCLPCREDTVRGYANVSLLIIDEAARVPDDLYRAVRPMLAVSGGRMICLSTPYGKRGFFHDCWTNGGADWARIEVAAEQILRIRRSSWPRSAAPWANRGSARSTAVRSRRWRPGLSGLCALRCPVRAGFPDGPACGRHRLRLPQPLRGGLGTLDRDDVLWLTGEHYVASQTLDCHAQRLPRGVTWYADPAGAGDRAALVRAGFEVHLGINAVSSGIAAVASRLNSATLRIQEGRCPNLLAEAQLYRYGEASETGPETPENCHNHALDALRYLINTVDAHRLARPRGSKPEEAAASDAAKKPEHSLEWLMAFTHDYDHLWTRIF